MNTTNSVSFTVTLNDYQLVIADQRWSIQGPDPQVVQQARRQLADLLASPEGRMLLDCCEPSCDPQIIEHAEEQLIKELDIPPAQSSARVEQADPKLQALALTMHLTFAPTITHEELTRRIHEFKCIRTYVELAWRALAGKRPGDSGLSVQQVNELSARLVRHGDLCARIVKAKLSLRTEKFDESHNPHDHSEKWRAPGEPSQHYQFNQNDPLYLEVTSILRREWKRYLPGFFNAIRRRLG